MIVPSLRTGSAGIAFFMALLVTGCVSVKNVEEEQIPETWRASRPPKSVPTVKFDLTVFGEGQSVHSDGRIARERLGVVFFPGANLRARSYRMTFDGAHQLTVAALDGDKPSSEITLDASVDAGTGMLLIKSIPIKASGKFGLVVSASLTATLYLGSDQALYVKVRQSGVGTVAVIPAGGVATWWGRWEIAP